MNTSLDVWCSKLIYAFCPANHRIHLHGIGLDMCEYHGQQYMGYVGLFYRPGNVRIWVIGYFIYFFFYPFVWLIFRMAYNSWSTSSSLQALSASHCMLSFWSMEILVLLLFSYYLFHVLVLVNLFDCLYYILGITDGSWLLSWCFHVDGFNNSLRGSFFTTLLLLSKLVKVLLYDSVSTLLLHRLQGTLHMESWHFLLLLTCSGVFSVHNLYLLLSNMEVQCLWHCNFLAVFWYDTRKKCYSTLVLAILLWMSEISNS